MAIDVSSQVAKADQAAAQRKYDMAIDYYLAALQIDPDHRGASSTTTRAGSPSSPRRSTCAG